MNLLDIRTVIFGYTISNLVCMIVMVFLWNQNRQRFAGLGFWLADFGMQFAGLVLLDLRGVLPGFWSMTVSNTLLIGGTVLIYIGLEQFTGRRGPQLQNYILLAAFIALHAFFVYIDPSLTIRSILVSLGLLAICSQCAWLTLRRVKPEMQLITRGVGFVFFAFCLVSVARVVVDLSTPQVSDFYRSSVYDILLILTYQMLFIMLTFSLSLMVNHRLFLELESDIKVRQEAEAALRLSEEKYFKAFQSSPDGILITRLRDGLFIEVNDGYCHMMGYTRDELFQASTIGLGVWTRPQDRDNFVAELHKNRSIRDAEYDFRTKSGAIIRCAYSSEIINLGGEPYVLSVVRDTTERKRADEILRLRLSLWEFLTTHTVEELMQKALDEIEALTGSAIGFYHFVEEDQNTLSLQAWSTRTLTEFCAAEGKGLHYPISDAGVWADCVYQRKPVIHNDYASLPNRKGMPAGHAEVVREVVVPIMRDGRVMAILGVGNKPVDYDEQDVELIAYIADLVWSIVDQKRANERIHLLNTQLEHLAMTDELTGLTNRRAFFIQGEKEIKRAQRYQTPLSMLMIDLDSFKTINDTYGHEAGDEMLRCIASTLTENIREIDVLARLGGEEFSVLLPNTDADAALILAERLRQAAEGLYCTFQDESVHVTMSIGVATFNAEMPDLDALLRIADTAMYRAKNQGRNRVVFLV